MINNESIYLWVSDYPVHFNDFKNRYHKVISVSNTHAYIKNLRTGDTMNYPISNFEKDFKSVVVRKT